MSDFWFLQTLLIVVAFGLGMGVMGTMFALADISDNVMNCVLGEVTDDNGVLQLARTAVITAAIVSAFALITIFSLHVVAEGSAAMEVHSQPCLQALGAGYVASLAARVVRPRAC